MQLPTKNSKHRGIARLRELGAITLMLVSMSLISACGGGGGGDNAEGGNKGGQGGAEQAGKAGGGNGGGTGGPAGADRPPVTDMRVIMASTDKGKLNGTRARFKGAEVRSIVSERAFFVGENDAEQMLVLNVGDGVEVSEGQKGLVAGKLITPKPELEERFSLTPEEAAAVNDQEIFLRAKRVVPQEG